MLTADVNLNELNRNMARLVAITGKNARLIVEKETGELIKTLVRVSPAAKANKIKDDIMRKFEWQSMPVNSPLEGKGKKSGSGIEWVRVNENYLTGIDPRLDMRNASVEELKQLSYKISKKGRITQPFLHPRTKQQVQIITQILTKLATVKKLAAAKAKNRGRLKASWLAGVVQGKIRLSGAYLPPGWVKRHANQNVAGNCRSGLAVLNNPWLEISSYAKGLSSRSERYFINKAIQIRAKAMAANAALILSGKKVYNG